jgi:hypothetical protein
MYHGGATGYVFGVKAHVNFLLCLANHFMLAFMVRRATRNFLPELVQSTELVLHYLFQAVYGAEILSYFFCGGKYSLTYSCQNWSMMNHIVKQLHMCYV